MRTTIDKAGRLVIAKPLRDLVGLVPGEVEVTVDGAGLRIEPVAQGRIVEAGGRLTVAASGTPIDDEVVRDLRRGDQR
jgi:bifunctional DNA-binding transcriptional regulator/antitoxin component of YhaV-PrlF toxin-antitoxin module